MSMSGDSIRTLGRARMQALVGRAGDRVAEVSLRPGSHKLLLQAIPQAMQRQFDPAQADDLEAVMELRVRDPSGGPYAPFELRIAHNTCTVRAGAASDPGAGAELGGDDMIRLVTGAVGWPELLGAGKLTMFGDPFLALRFPLLFGLPASATT